MPRSVPVVAIALVLALAASAEAGGLRRVKRAATKLAPSRGIVSVFETTPIRGTIRTVGGSNGGRLVSLGALGRSKGIFKPASAEGPGRVWLLGRVRVGTYYRRDVAAWRLSEAIGLGMVPPTVERELGGEVGSLQLWADDARALSEFKPRRGGPQFERSAAERVRAFDFIMGNADRKLANMLVAVDESSGEARYTPVAIDHGSSLPLTGRFEFRWPLEWIESHDGPVLDETRAFLRAIEPATVVEALGSAGIERQAVLRAVYRLERLKRDPDLLALGDRGGMRGARQMLQRMRWAALRPTQGLPRDARRELARAVDSYFR
jgi:hypothetical protein